MLITSHISFSPRFFPPFKIAITWIWQKKNMGEKKKHRKEVEEDVKIETLETQWKFN